MTGRITVLITLIIFSFSVINDTQAQTYANNAQNIVKTPLKSRSRIDPAGFVTLPDGFKVIRTKNWADAWLGYIESADGKLKISFGAGMVESLFTTYKKKFLWTRTEGTSNLINIGWLRIKKVDTLVARTGWIEFSAPIKQETDKEIFMEIVRSYSRKP